MLLPPHRMRAIPALSPCRAGCRAGSGYVWAIGERLEAQIGVAAARADYLPGALVDRLLDGESPVRIWREHRGLSARRLAEMSSVSAGYLCEIEAGRKPGSSTALHGIAQALRVPMETLISV